MISERIGRASYHTYLQIIQSEYAYLQIKQSFTNSA